MSYQNPWLYEGKIFDSEDIGDYLGFVYKLKNLSNGHQYIGKKFFHTTKYRQINKKKKRYFAESDWKEYYSSNKDIQEQVIAIGGEKFTRTIIKLCKSKGELSYYETKFIFEYDCLLSPMWYNKYIICRINAAHIYPKGKRKKRNVATG